MAPPPGVSQFGGNSSKIFGSFKLQTFCNMLNSLALISIFDPAAWQVNKGSRQFFDGRILKKLKSMYCNLAMLRSSLMVALLVLTVSPAWAQRPLGTDVSGYQTSIDWTTVKNAGVTFAWTKATEATDYVNPYFGTQESGAQAQGILIGAYHFARPSDDPNVTGPNSADSEADYYWSVAGNYIKNGGHYLVPMLDWEDPGISNQLSVATMSAWVNEWCNAIVRYGVTNGLTLKPVVYTYTSYAAEWCNSTVTNWPLWMANYPSPVNAQTGTPGSTTPWPSWNIWQYADTNTSGGDSDVYNGTRAGFLQMFVVGGTNAPYFANPTNITVAQGANATFSIKPSGLAPLAFQWYFNGSLIPSATGSNYTIIDAQLASVGAYDVVVSNSYAVVTSSAASLSVIAPQTNAPGSVLAPPGMVNWWPAEGNPLDIFGTNNATPNGGLTYITGEVGLAFHFNDTNSYLLVSGGTSNAPPWTACMWVNRSASPFTSAALMGDELYSLKLEQYNATHQVGITKSGVEDYTFTPAYTAPAGVWTHLTFVGTSSSVTLYTNGVMEGSISVSGFMLPRAAIGCNLIGNGNPTDVMLGGLDELQVYNNALTATQIKSIYSAGSAGLVKSPQFTGITASSSGQVQLDMQGITGKTFSIYDSPDLINWTKLATISNPSGALQYQNSPTDPAIFYKISQP
jgi:GH25 family lysozyme M1 (1,4-beta-N-acetylmuramidase)